MTTNGGDNILWFFEGQYFLFNGLKVYGTFMIDELQTKQIFNTFYGNRWASQAGIFLAHDLFSYPVDIRIEWTAVRPWTYTHRIPIYGAYTHNTRSIGFKYGPNTQLLHFESNLWFNFRNRFKLIIEQFKFGVEPEKDRLDDFDFGNKLKDDYQNSNPEYHNKTNWLIGSISTVYSLNLAWNYQFSNIIDFDINYSFAFIDSINNSENSISFKFNFNY